MLETAEKRPQTAGASSDRICDTPDRSRGWIASLRIVSLWTFASRVLGLLRDVLMASVFGNGAVMDAFSVAFRVPNMARRLFGEGALTTVFLPAYVHERERNGDDSAWKLAATVFLGVAALLAGIVVFAEAVLWIAARSMDAGSELRLLLFLTAVLVPYLFLICLAGQFCAVLQSRGHFTIPAVLPVLLNVTWIGTLVFVLPYWNTLTEKMTAACVGILIGGAIQFVLPMAALKRLGFRWRTDWGTYRPQLFSLGRTLVPVLVALSVTQINTLADSLIAWGLSRPEQLSADAAMFGDVAYPMESGTASALYFAQRMYQFPLGVFGVALGTVLFPLFARQALSGDWSQMRQSMGTGLRLVVAIGLPASVGLVLLAEPITQLLFQHGQFDAADAQQTALLIAVYGGAVWAFCGLLIVQRVFFAMNDRTTPLRVGLLAVVLNIALNLALIWPLGGNGLALATGLTSIIQLGVLLLLLRHHPGAFDWRRLTMTTFKTGFACGVMAGGCLLSLAMIEEQPEFLVRSARVVIPLIVSVAVFGLVARLIRLEEPWVLIRANAVEND